MYDLNALFYFAQVVEHGGFMAAGRALGIPKSRLSRHVAELEERLGVRLLQRTTRSLTLTDIGQHYYRHCQAVLAEADAAEETIARVRAEPRGRITVTCPEQLSKTLLGPILPRFLAQHPHVRIALESSNRRVDLIEEGVDVALRVRSVIEDTPSLIARPLGLTQLDVVASPGLLARIGVPAHPAALAALPCLCMPQPDGRGTLTMLDGDGHEIRIVIDQPRLATDDLQVLLEAARAGVGIAALPRLLCQPALDDGQLVTLLPEYRIPGGILHAVFPTRRGLLPAVRAFIDFICAELVPPDHPGYQRL